MLMENTLLLLLATEFLQAEMGHSLRVSWAAMAGAALGESCCSLLGCMCGEQQIPIVFALFLQEFIGYPMLSFMGLSKTVL